MRKVLLRIVFDRFWGFQEAGNELHIGVGWLIIVWLALATGSATLLWRKRQSVREVGISIGFWAVVPVALLLIRKTGLPLVQV